ncbi:MAG: tripartite tricarboxylate transporter substrate binding protein [Betaproteobacteria bacterium]|nr:tripartite tricarboxylate transporter substrate binding protein [Betaproteobacteria bacterium]
MRFLKSAVLSLVIGALFAALSAHAAYPEKPIRIIVPWAPGGTTDILARTVADKLHVALGQPVIVENRPGAAGNIGSELVAKSKADGYMLLFGLMNTHVVNPALYKTLPFKGVEDFTPIAMLAIVVTTMVIHPSVPANNIRQFIALARANPGKLAYASAGTGSSTHLNAVLFEKMAGIQMLHVPYKGGAPAVLDTITGQTQMLISAATQTLPHVKAGKLRLLGVTRSKRVAMLPDVPAIAETLPGYEATVWFGAFGPAGMPKEVTMKLNAEINRIMTSPEVKKRMDDIGVEVVNTTPEQFLATLRQEVAHWAKVIREFNIKAD